MNYHNELKEKIMLFLSEKISIKELIYWANKVYDNFFASKEYEYLKYRLINNTLIELKDLEDDLENVNCLSEEEHDYITDVLKNDLCYLNGEVNYIETYKVKLNSENIDASIKKIIEDSLELISNKKEFSSNLINSLNKIISNNPCLTISDILVNEMVNSILLVKESIVSDTSEILIGTLGKSTDSHKREDEIDYLEKLNLAFSGRNSIRFSLVINAEKLLLTNIFVIRD